MGFRLLPCILLALVVGQAGVAQDEPEYLLGPEDRVLIRVWTRDDLSAEVEIGPDGYLRLPPLVQAVLAAGRTEADLGKELTQHLQVIDPGIPEVLVEVLQYNSQSIRVVGEVRNPALYGFRRIPDLWEVILRAGGPTPSADLSGVLIERAQWGEGEPRSISVDLSGWREGIKPESLPPLRPKDTVVVPSTITETTSTGGSSFQVLGFVRSPGVYHLNSAGTVVEALARSGGHLPEADLSKVQLTRSTPSGVVAYRLDIRDLLFEGKSTMDMTLKEGDTLTVPAKGVGATSLLDGLLRIAPIVAMVTGLIIAVQAVNR